jgi:hypothetical protein
MSDFEAIEFSKNENFKKDYQTYLFFNRENPLSLLEWVKKHPWLNEIARRNRGEHQAI